MSAGQSEYEKVIAASIGIFQRWARRWMLVLEPAPLRRRWYPLSPRAVVSSSWQFAPRRRFLRCLASALSTSAFILWEYTTNVLTLDTHLPNSLVASTFQCILAYYLRVGGKHLLINELGNICYILLNNISTINVLIVTRTNILSIHCRLT